MRQVEGWGTPPAASPPFAAGGRVAPLGASLRKDYVFLKLSDFGRFCSMSAQMNARDWKWPRIREQVRAFNASRSVQSFTLLSADCSAKLSASLSISAKSLHHNAVP